MVVALFALSLVMVVGGVAAVIQGFPYVRLESGLAMVVGGATAASAGVILLGLSAVVARLRRIEDVLAGTQVVGGTSALAEPARSAAPVGGPVAPDFGTPPERTPAPALAGTAGPAGIAVAGAGAAAIGAGRRGAEPTFADPAPAHPAAPEDAALDGGRREPGPADHAAEPLLPDLLPPEPYPAPRAVEAHSGEAHEVPPPIPDPVHAAPAEEDLFASGEPEPAREEALGLRPALAETAAAAEPAAAVEAEAPERQVVGTYASGGNTYVMYADGSIQADTPRGLFRFDSLDELKAFVDSGGEADARGAA